MFRFIWSGRRFGGGRAFGSSTRSTEAVSRAVVETLEQRKLLAVHPAPELANIAFTPLSYAVPSGAYWVSATSTSNTLSTNSGSPGSLAHTLDNAPAGSTVILRGGDYRTSHNLSRRLNVFAAPGERPIFKGTDVVTNWTRVGTQNLWFTPWSTKLTGNEPRTTNPNFPESIDFDQVYRNGLSVNQTRDNPLTQAVEGRANNAFGPGKFWIGTVNNEQRVYVADNPNTATMEVSRRNNNFNFGNGSGGSVVRGITFVHGGTNGTTVSTPNITLESNMWAWNANFGLGVYGANTTLRGNQFVSNGHNGVSGHFGQSNTAGGLVENNTFAHNNAEAFANSWNAAAFKTTQVGNLVVRNNLFENNYTSGLWMDVHTNNPTVVNNISRNNQGFGIFFESSHAATIAFNTVHNNSWAGLRLADASGAQIWNNTFHNNGIAVQVTDGNRFNRQEDSAINFDARQLVNGSWEITRENVVKNNIFSSSNQFQIDAGVNVFGQQQDPDPRTTFPNGNVRWSDTEVPEGQSRTYTEGGQTFTIFNPRPLTHLGSRSMFYASDGTTGTWTAVPNAINSNMFHNSPSKATNRGPVNWRPIVGQAVVQYTPAEFNTSTDQNGRFLAQGSAAPMFNNPGGGDLRLNPQSLAVGYGESLPNAVRNAATAAGVVINDPVRPSLGSQPVAGALVTNGGFGNGTTGWITSGNVSTSAGGRTGAGLRIVDSGGARQVVSGLVAGGTYELRGFLRVASGTVSVNMGVRNYGGNQVQQTTISGSYVYQAQPFTLGATNTSAEIYVNRGGTGEAWADDLLLVRIA